MTERKLGILKSFTSLDADISLPSVEQFDVQTMDSPDIFITALGFEERVLKIPELIANAWVNHNVKSVVAILGEYTTNVNDNENNRDPLLRSIDVFCSTVASLDADNPSVIYKDISNAIQIEFRRKQSKVHILFDISGASGNFIISAMRAFMEMAEIVELNIAYTEAENYFPQVQKDQKLYNEAIDQAHSLGDETSIIEFGVQNPEKNELHTGQFHDNRPDYVIAIPSFRANRMLRCLNSINDEILASPRENIYWIFGAPPNEKNGWRPKFQYDFIIKMLQRISGSGSAEANTFINDNNHVNISTFDYKKIISAIFDIAEKNLGKRISLIHMGSKMQSIGIALVLSARDEIAVTFARPGGFNCNKYSEGIGPAWSIKFNDLNMVVNTLKKIGTIEYQPINYQKIT